MAFLIKSRDQIAIAIRKFKARFEVMIELIVIIE